MERNTAFVYLYRDASNYKEWGRVVFEGKHRAAHVARLRKALQRGELFCPWQVRVPQVYRYLAEGESIDERDDHGWHEFVRLEESDEPCDDDAGRSIEEFVEEVEAASEAGWRVLDAYGVRRRHLAG